MKVALSLSALTSIFGGRAIAKFTVFNHLRGTVYQQSCRRMSEQQQRQQQQQQNSDVEIRVCKSGDEQPVLQFLRTHYYHEEPLTVGSEPKQQEAADEQQLMSNLPLGTCLVALQSNQIVGHLNAAPKDASEEALMREEAKRHPMSKWSRQLLILAKTECEANVFERYNVKTALHVHALAVNGQVRGRAIGKRLMQESMQVGLRLGFPLITIDCTSYYSQQLCERMGLDCVNVIWYKDYLNEQGKQIYQPPPPHTSLKTYAMRLKPTCNDDSESAAAKAPQPKSHI